jgi:hypothetical protein
VCNETEPFDYTWTPPSGYVIDLRKGDPGHRGLSLERDNTHPQTRDTTFHSITYEITEDNVHVYGWVKGKAAIGYPPHQIQPPIAGYLDKVFTVHFRSAEPKPGSGGLIIKNPVLITARGLTTSLTSGVRCIERSSDQNAPSPQALAEDQLRESIVDELAVKVDSAALSTDGSSEAQESEIKEALKQVQFAMSSSGRLRRRRPYGAVGFLESNYFKDQIRPHLPEELPPEELPS